MSESKRPMTPLAMASGLVVVLGIPFLPLLISWRWDWLEAWLFALVSVLGFVGSRLLAGRAHPDLLTERARSLQLQDAESWDRYLAPLVGIGSGLIPLVAGIEARFDESPAFGWTAKTISLIFIVAGYALGTYAMVENRFFSGVVRIQADRDHRVVASGPYRWIRHPGYAGALLAFTATPVLLDSVWAFVPVALLTSVLVARTRLEDATLENRLEDYRDYASRVRYRLVPGVW